MMKRLAAYATLLVFTAALPFGAVAQQTTPGQQPAPSKAAPGTNAQGKSNPEARFMTKAAEHNLGEVELGKLAGERASSDEVKKFGQRMATDHQKAYDELKKLAETKGVTLASHPDDKARKEHERLSKLSGNEFDRAYMQLMVREHERDVKEFERASKSAKDPDVKAWAAQTLPTLREHHKMARDVATQMRSAARSAATPSASPGTTKASPDAKK